MRSNFVKNRIEDFLTREWNGNFNVWEDADGKTIYVTAEGEPYGVSVVKDTDTREWQVSPECMLTQSKDCIQLALVVVSALREIYLSDVEMELYRRIVTMIADCKCPSGASTFEETEYQDWFEGMVGLYPASFIDRAAHSEPSWWDLYRRIEKYHNDLKYILQDKKHLEEWEKWALEC